MFIVHGGLGSEVLTSLGNNASTIVKLIRNESSGLLDRVHVSINYKLLRDDHFGYIIMKTFKQCNLSLQWGVNNSFKKFILLFAPFT